MGAAADPRASPALRFGALLALGVALRLVWAFSTTGQAYDIASYEALERTLRDGWLDAYSTLGEQRWPYPPAYFPVVWLMGLVPGPTSSWIALPPIAADAAIAYVVWRRAPEQRLLAAGAVLLGPSFLVTSGFHHQLDSVAILPAVLAVAWATRPGAQGALLGLAAGLKTVPGLVLLALLPHARRRAVLVGSAALTFAAICLPWVLADGRAMLRQLDYTGVPGAGGLSLVVHPEAALRWLVRPVAPNGAEQLLIDARWLVVAVVVVVGAWLWARRPPAAWGAAVLFLALWSFGPAFFLQYAVWGLPFLLLAGRVGLAVALQALLVVPLALFYGGPFASEAVAVPYVAAMLAFWLVCVVALTLGEKRGRSLLLTRGEKKWPTPFLVLAAFGFAPLAWLQLRAWRSGEAFTGVDGLFAGDGLQYLWWIRDAGEHGLVANGFDLAPADHVFTTPMIALSGLLAGWGLDLGWALQLWKPVAIAALLAGFGAYVARTVEGDRARAAALVLALAGGAPLLALASRAGADLPEALGVMGKGLPAAHLHGYLPAALSFALMPAFLLLLERGRLAGAAAAGLLAAWLHPWQGVVLVLVAAGLVAWERDRRAVGPALATAVPLLAYAALARLDPSWEVGQRQNETATASPLVLLLAFLPFLAAALPELRRRPVTTQDRVLRLWPVAAVLAALTLPSVPLHALGGITLPLAVLAVRGAPRLAHPAVAVAFALPSLLVYADGFRDLVRTETQAHALRPGEAAALRALPPGGVLAHGRIATAVPALAGRRVWAGHPSWTPDFEARTVAAARLATGALPPDQARALVRGSGARSVLVGCEAGTADLSAALGVPGRRFGCATVYRLP